MSLLTHLIQIIYVARHPRDVAVSFYYLMSSFMTGFTGTFEEFWTLFEKNECKCATDNNMNVTFVTDK